jgi:hypothetical protein
MVDYWSKVKMKSLGILTWSSIGNWGAKASFPDLPSYPHCGKTPTFWLFFPHFKLISSTLQFFIIRNVEKSLIFPQRVRNHKFFPWWAKICYIFHFFQKKNKKWFDSRTPHYLLWQLIFTTNRPSYVSGRWPCAGSLTFKKKIAEPNNFPLLEIPTFISNYFSFFPHFMLTIWEPWLTTGFRIFYVRIYLVISHQICIM